MVRIFVSYKHSTAKWVLSNGMIPCGVPVNDPNNGLSLIEMLQKSFGHRDVEVEFIFDYRFLEGNAKFDKVIRTMIDSSSIAILLIGSDFLREDGYVYKEELPYILDCYKSGKIIIVPIFIEKMNNDDYNTLLNLLPEEYKSLIDVEQPTTLFDLYNDNDTKFREYVNKTLHDKLSEIIKICNQEVSLFKKIQNCNSEVGAINEIISECEKIIQNNYLSEPIKQAIQAKIDKFEIRKEMLVALPLDSSAKALSDYIKKHPKALFIAEVKERLVAMEQTDYLHINEGNLYSSYIKFKDVFHFSEHIDELRHRYYELVKKESHKLIDKINKKGNINYTSLVNELDLFLESYKRIEDNETDKLIGDIDKRRTVLQEKIEKPDKIKYERAVKANTIESFEECKRNCKSEKYKALAQTEIDAIIKLKAKRSLKKKKFCLYTLLSLLLICGIVAAYQNRMIKIDLLDAGVPQFTDVIANPFIKNGMTSTYRWRQNNKYEQQKTYNRGTNNLLQSTSELWYCEYNNLAVKISNSKHVDHNKIDSLLKLSIKQNKPIGMYNMVVYSGFNEKNKYLLEKAAILGFPPAITELALYNNNNNSSIDSLKRYTEQFKLAASLGDSKANYIMFKILESDFRTKEMAHKYLVSAAESGWIEALNMLFFKKHIEKEVAFMRVMDIFYGKTQSFRGLRYHNDFGALKDVLLPAAYTLNDMSSLRALVDYYVSNIDIRHTNGVLAYMYYMGIGYENDVDKSFELLNQERKKSQSYLGENIKLKAQIFLDRQEPDSAYVELLNLKGLFEYQFSYILAYYNIMSNEKDIQDKGNQQMYNLADGGHDIAKLYRACQIMKGCNGVKQDTELALKLFNEIICNKNDNSSIYEFYALYNLGNIYHYGAYKCKKDIQKSKDCFTKVKSHKLFEENKSKIIFPVK